METRTPSLGRRLPVWALAIMVAFLPALSGSAAAKKHVTKHAKPKAKAVVKPKPKPTDEQPPDDSATATPPILPPNLTVRPAFVDSVGNVQQAGTAFGVALDNGQVFLLSALDLFGPLGGLPKQIAAARLPDLIVGVYLASMDRAQQVGLAGKPLLRTGYPISDKANTPIDVTGDLVAFAMTKDKGCATAPLAKEDPAPGMDVWLVGKAAGAPGASADLFHGFVSIALRGSSPKALVVRMDDETNFKGFSGAPFVNASGEIVGMEIGGTTYNGKPYALANPVSSIRDRLQSITGSTATP